MKLGSGWPMWLGLVVLGAPMNVLVNLGYKFATSTQDVVWLACATMAVAATALLGWGVWGKRADVSVLGQGKLPWLVLVAGLAGCVVFMCFLTALKYGPISLVDPLWACVYALVSLVVGMVMVRERPALGAVLGIGVYLAGAALMGIGGHQGGGEATVWVWLVLAGATANVFINLMFKIYGQRVEKALVIGAVYGLAAVGLGVCGLVTAPDGWQPLLVGIMPWIVLGMGLAIPVIMLMMVTALVQGPISIVDPLWACIYGLGSVLVGMALLGESPTLMALVGVGVYLIGAGMMGWFGRRTGLAKGE